MLRHLIITFLIVAGVYLGLLVAIDHPFVANAQDNTASKSLLSVAEPNARLSQGADTKEQGKVKEEGRVVDNTTTPITVFGIKKRIDFDKVEKQVVAAWTEFSSNKPLQNNVDWNKGNIMVYAYFYDFNRDMSKGSLMIGYDRNDLLLNSDAANVTLPKGKPLKFQYITSYGTAEEKAWEAAYHHKNLIERHTLDTSGDIISSDVIVIQ